MFGVRKLKSLGYNPVLIAWLWTLLSRNNTCVWQTDRQTDRQTLHDSIYRAMHMCRAETNNNFKLVLTVLRPLNYHVKSQGAIITVRDLSHSLTATWHECKCIQLSFSDYNTIARSAVKSQRHVQVTKFTKCLNCSFYSSVALMDVFRIGKCE